ncbi:PEP-CTERM sorting domain-containing protein [Nitrosovibrio sp. Nv17]|uniref:Npun_F0296 family exosortase-dependent surface protein n=1 Tax=Nitrosovibrio sp. Nv17 TaxID=1855339 RepID=UPI000908E576|nr:PEP-CTERM sorting domain-containing protein [Nitrosovibrio sp. Nv17]SFW25141.1 PEP-CTERM protein-sorting domain-containing protein [Nitrosovibrio sp. Nv17]
MSQKTKTAHGIMGALALGLGLASTGSMAALLNASVGGVPVGANIYESFDTLSSLGGATGNGITVLFSGDGAGVATLPNVEGQYAAPYLSNGNGTLFGNPQPDGQDATQYLTAGIGDVTLLLDEHHQYFGLLWGSVDDYNTLSFYDGNTFLFSYTGSDVDTLANGRQGADGTYYVNINSDTPFNKVVASSSSYAFEFDNVALAYTPVELPQTSVPEPGTLALLGIGLLASAIRRRTR